MDDSAKIVVDNYTKEEYKGFFICTTTPSFAINHLIGCHFVTQVENRVRGQYLWSDGQLHNSTGGNIDVPVSGWFRFHHEAVETINLYHLQNSV